MLATLQGCGHAVEESSGRDGCPEHPGWHGDTPAALPLLPGSALLYGPLRQPDGGLPRQDG